MTDHLTDEEQLRVLKHWWKKNGSSLVTAVFIGVMAYIGFQWWQNYQQQQAEQASALYSELLKTIGVEHNNTLPDEKKNTARYLIKQLKDNYKSSQYATNASLFAAKMFVDAHDLKAAEQELLWATDHAREHLKPLIQLRLARVYVAQEKYPEALSIVDQKLVEQFGSLYAELKGDILAAQQDWENARVAYQQANGTLENTSSFRRNLLPIKLSNLPAGKK
ncbi:hypothetical protein AB835_13890 [Candidatus Endobugula sertula]|uniref:Ancillary SecYEG translocon subunit/Cell division coordinator CpoB TPR domain-containing protein n=1 Tax=Candidatus Endobugula sertula TaxID=62101 RepID=A0A1D2QLN8_9GAMM|nr:hypothetical protein AB835_13890 [Candidatus Endobugula sertula]